MQGFGPVLMSAADLLQIYRGIIDLTVTKFRDSDSLYIGIKETGYCILRSQLLMTCHDKPQFRHLAMQVGSLDIDELPAPGRVRPPACLSVTRSDPLGAHAYLTIVAWTSSASCLVGFLKGMHTQLGCRPHRIVCAGPACCTSSD